MPCRRRIAVETPARGPRRLVIPVRGGDGVFASLAILLEAYAEEVIARMAAKALRAVAVLDVPDVARRDEAEAFRRGVLGAEAYERRYRGLEHRYFGRPRIAAAL